MIQRDNIQWEIGKREDEAGDGHTFFHLATGVDKKTGKHYTAKAVLVDDNLEEIEDIEEEQP